MTIVPLIIDAPVQLGGGCAAASLLATPLGTCTMLSYVCARIRELAPLPPGVLTTFDPDAAYIRALAICEQPTTAVTPLARFADLLDAFEPADRLLLVDPRCFPQEGLDLSGLLQGGDGAIARHYVPLARAADGIKEFVQLGPGDAVRRIQRLYDGVTRVEASGVSCSLLTVSAARAASDLPLRTLGGLRMALTSRGIPAQDVPYAGDWIDLSEQAGLLHLSELFVAQEAATRPPAGYRFVGDGVLIGPNARVASAARIVGPVVVQPAATVERGAVVVGPAVLGRAAHVGREAVVAQCVVLAGAQVAAGDVCRQRVVGGVNSDSVDRERRGAPPRRRYAAIETTRGAGSVPAARSRRAYRIVKRGLDVAVATAGLAALAPLLALTALLIKLTSRGPVFYLDEREGLHGRRFLCLKFRTMVPDAHARQRELYAHSEVDGPQFKMRRDPRITPLGRFLRKYNVDELPQLFNVLRGDMSLIGPRPSPFRENQICVPWRNARLSVRPGITGLWQICRAARDAGDFHQWIYYDTLYVKHLSMALDLRILAATLVTFGGRFSVPLHWIVPADRVQADPVLERDRLAATPDPAGSRP